MVPDFLFKPNKPNMKQDDSPASGYSSNTQPQSLPITFSPELINTIKEGFVHEFHFMDGYVVCATGTNRFHIKDVIKTPRPCTDSQTVVYRIITPTGVMGYAVVEMKQDNDE